LKNAFFRIACFFCFLVSSGQELEGVWLNYNNRILDEFKSHTTGDEGMFFDFDTHTLGFIQSDSLFKIKVRSKNNLAKIKIAGIRGKGKFKIFGKDSLEADSSNNKIRVFRKLDLSHKIDMTEEEISEFLISNSFDSIQGIKGHFSPEQFFRDRIFGRPHIKNQFENKSWDDAGYWYIKKIKNSAFLIFTIGQTEKMNILQIKSLNKKGLQVNHLQEDKYMRNLIEINTCLQ